MILTCYLKVRIFVIFFNFQIFEDMEAQLRVIGFGLCQQ